MNFAVELFRAKMKEFPQYDWSLGSSILQDPSIGSFQNVYFKTGLCVGRGNFKLEKEEWEESEQRKKL